MTTRTAFTQPQGGLQGFARNMKCFGGRVAFVVGDLVTGNIVEAFIVPAGFTVLNIIAVASDMDSNGSPALTLSVGDASSGTRFLNASTIGQTGATTQTLASTGLLFAYTADTKILVTATAGAATAVAGTLDLYLTGFIAG